MASVAHARTVQDYDHLPPNKFMAVFGPSYGEQQYDRDHVYIEEEALPTTDNPSESDWEQYLDHDSVPELDSYQQFMHEFNWTRMNERFFNGMDRAGYATGLLSMAGAGASLALDLPPRYARNLAIMSLVTLGVGYLMHRQWHNWQEGLVEVLAGGKELIIKDIGDRQVEAVEGDRIYQRVVEGRLGDHRIFEGV